MNATKITDERRAIEKRLIKFLRDNPEWLEREFTWWQIYDAMRESVKTDWEDTSKQYEAV